MYKTPSVFLQIYNVEFDVIALKRGQEKMYDELLFFLFIHLLKEISRKIRRFLWFRCRAVLSLFRHWPIQNFTSENII